MNLNASNYKQEMVGNITAGRGAGEIVYKMYVPDFA